GAHLAPGAGGACGAGPRALGTVRGPRSQGRRRARDVACGGAAALPLAGRASPARAFVARPQGATRFGGDRAPAPPVRLAGAGRGGPAARPDRGLGAGVWPSTVAAGGARRGAFLAEAPPAPHARRALRPHGSYRSRALASLRGACAGEARPRSRAAHDRRRPGGRRGPRRRGAVARAMGSLAITTKGDGPFRPFSPAG